MRFEPSLVKSLDTNLKPQFRLVVHGQRRHQLTTTTTMLLRKSQQLTRPGLQGIKKVKLVISMIGQIFDSK